MATNSSNLTWKIPWTEKPDKLYIVQGVPKSWTWLTDWAHTQTHTDRQRKAGACRLIGNHTFWVKRVPRSDKKSGEMHTNVNFCSLCFHYNRISLKQKKSMHHAPMPWHFCPKLMRTEFPPPLREGKLGWKIREVSPQTPPPVNIVPLHLYVPHNWLAKEAQGNSSSPAQLLSLCILA